MGNLAIRSDRKVVRAEGPGGGNPLIPPPGVEAGEWLMKLVDVLKHAYFVGWGLVVLSVTELFAPILAVCPCATRRPCRYTLTRAQSPGRSPAPAASADTVPRGNSLRKPSPARAVRLSGPSSTSV